MTLTAHKIQNTHNTPLTETPSTQSQYTFKRELDF